MLMACLSSVSIGIDPRLFFLFTFGFHHLHRLLTTYDAMISYAIRSPHLQARDGQGRLEVVRRLPLRRGVCDRVPPERHGASRSVRGPGNAGVLPPRAEGARSRPLADDGRQSNGRHRHHRRRRPVLLDGAFGDRRTRRLGHGTGPREYRRHLNQPESGRAAAPHHL